MFMSIKFLYLTKNISDVGHWIRLVVLLANQNCICLLIRFTGFYFIRESSDETILTNFISGVAIYGRFSVMLTWGQLIRLDRVQVQLRAQQETTKAIINSMSRSKHVEYFFKTILVLYELSLFFYFFPNLITPDGETKYYWYQICSIFYDIFISIFCIQMWKVNTQLSYFFESINDRSYPNNSIKIHLAIYLLTGGLSNAFRFIQGFYPEQIHINWVYLAVNTWLIYEQVFFVLYTAFLLYLSDVNYKHRASIKKVNTMETSGLLFTDTDFGEGTSLKAGKVNGSYHDFDNKSGKLDTAMAATYLVTESDFGEINVRKEVAKDLKKVFKMPKDFNWAW